MSKHELRDRNNRLLGTIRQLPNGKHEGRDANGRLVGTYDPSTDQTRDASYRLVGKGDTLAVLIVE